MGNAEFQVPSHIKEEWTESLSHGKRIFRNRVTEEQFELFVLSKLKSQQQIPLLIERSIYPLPNTPKVIILNDQLGEVSILIQRPKLSLKNLLQGASLKLDLLHLLSRLVKTIRGLYQRYGAFTLSEEMIGANEGSELLVWLNQSFEASDAQFPIRRSPHPQKDMSAQIVTLIGKYCELPLERKLLNNLPLTFSVLLNKISESILAEKELIASLKTKAFVSKKQPRQFLSPQAQNSNNKNSQQKPQLQRNSRKPKCVPNFIKSIKNPKDQPQLHFNFLSQKQLNPNNPFSLAQQKPYSKDAISRVRSHNCSPQPKQHKLNLNQSGSTAYASVNSFQAGSSGKINTLTFSKNSTQSKNLQSTFKFHKHPSNATTGYSVKFQEITGKNLITEQDEKQSFERNNSNDRIQTTFQRTKLNAANKFLHSFCKNMSYSRDLQLYDNSQILKDLDQEDSQNCSVIIHQNIDSSFGDNNHILLKQDFHKIFF